MNAIEQFWELVSKKSKLYQIEKYVQKKSPEYITKFIQLGGGPRMGVMMEDYARFKFSSLKKRGSGKNTWFDQLIVVNGKDVHIEQKSSGHWDSDDYRWQHVEPEHKWDMLLLCGIDYFDIKFWGMNRKTFDALVTEKKITTQSKQGMWFNYSVVKDHLTPIESDADLLRFAEQVVREQV